MNWYGITLGRGRATSFKEFCRADPSILTFEPSSCYDNIHIEFGTELPFEEVINRFIDWERKEEI